MRFRVKPHFENEERVGRAKREETEGDSLGSGRTPSRQYFFRHPCRRVRSLSRRW